MSPHVLDADRPCLAIVVTGSVGHAARRARPQPLESAAQRSGFRIAVIAELVLVALCATMILGGGAVTMLAVFARPGTGRQAPSRPASPFHGPIHASARL